jgi:adenylylsulfate kinase
MKGIYVLIIAIDRNISVDTGALGNLNFEKGLYAYVGSAQNNLEERIKRHFRTEKTKFWHIDYLLDNSPVKVLKVFYDRAGKPKECEIAKELAKKGFPIRGFGSSDCNCESHLIKVEDYQFLREHMSNCSGTSMKERASARPGWCVWVTGLPGSGKSVVSEVLLKLLDQENISAQLLSVDALRKVLTSKPSYSLEERDAVYATLVYFAELLTKNGVNVVIDATGNLRRFRDDARKRIPKFIEVYLECPIRVCMDREAKRRKTHLAPRKIYSRALKGEAPTVPGIGQPYEPPVNPEVTVNTTKCSPQECARKILQKLLLVKA